MAVGAVPPLFDDGSVFVEVNVVRPATGHLAMSVGRALHVDSSSHRPDWARIEGTAWCGRSVQRVSLALFVAALRARALARMWSGTVQSVVIIVFASAWVIGRPSRSWSW